MLKYLFLLIFSISLFAQDWDPSSQLSSILECETWSEKTNSPKVDTSVWGARNNFYYDHLGACSCLVKKYSYFSHISPSDHNSFFALMQSNKYFFKENNREPIQRGMMTVSSLSDEEEYKPKIKDRETRELLAKINKDRDEKLRSFYLLNKDGFTKFKNAWKDCLSNNKQSRGDYRQSKLNSIKDKKREERRMRIESKNNNR